MRKIKLTCRQKDGRYEKQLFVDGESLADAGDTETQSAERFLNAFQPETLTQECAKRYGEDFVLVMRTDDVQMQEFDALLCEHGQNNNSQNQP